MISARRHHQEYVVTYTTVKKSCSLHTTHRSPLFHNQTNLHMMQTCKWTWNQLSSVTCHSTSRDTLILKANGEGTKNPKNPQNHNTKASSKQLLVSKAFKTLLKKKKKKFFFYYFEFQFTHFQAIWSILCRSLTYYPHYLAIKNSRHCFTLGCSFYVHYAHATNVIKKGRKASIYFIHASSTYIIWHV